MPIRFPCQRCGRLLAIASRKAGVRVACPECGCVQTVPTPEAAADIMAERARAQGPAVEAPPGGEYDDESSLVGAAGHRGEGYVESGSPSPPPPLDEAARLMPSGTILYRRRTLYFQALLFLLLAVGAFAAGYFVGRGDAERLLRPEFPQAGDESTPGDNTPEDDASQGPGGEGDEPSRDGGRVQLP